MPTPRAWTDEDRERIAEYLREGKSMGRIGRLLGLTRNAVIGRVARDGALHVFVGRNYVARKIQRDKPTRLDAEPVVPELASEPQGHDLPAEAATVVPFVLVLSDAAGKPLYELTSDDCHWPIEEDDEVVGGFLFCGEPVRREGGPYCARHYAMAVQPPRRGLS